MNIRANNNFDFMRFFAATLVLFSHSFALAYGPINHHEPLIELTNGAVSFGTVSVIIFFIISGFLISASWDGRQNISKYLVARALRIFPALAAMLVVVVLAGTLITIADTQSYLSSATTYFLKNISLYKGQNELTGVFIENPYGQAINGSLWTLRLEFTCYLIIGLMGILAIFNRVITWLIWALAVALSLSPEIQISFFKSLFPLLAWFSSGMLAYFYREWLDKKWRIQYSALAGATIITFLILHLNMIFISPIVAYLLIMLAYTKGAFVSFGKYGDFSYGLYIYAFPIQQLTVYLMSKYSPIPIEWWSCFIISFPLTLVFSILSWHLVEARFLRSRTR